jgi:uncharacterized protein YcgL (UPF0745 family)
MVICDVYKSDKKDGLYLYVDHAEGLVRVPEALLMQFGVPRLTLSFELHVDRRMARQDPQVVLKNLNADGYHMQLPPAPYSPSPVTHTVTHSASVARNAPATQSTADRNLTRGAS